MDGQFHRAPHHERGELGVGRRGLGFADDLAEADDGDAICDFSHLAELMGDEHDRGALVAKLTHDVHQLVGLLRSEDGGRLVEDEYPGIPRQRLDDLHTLLDADGEIADDRVGVDLEAEALSDVAHVLACLGEVEAAEPLRLLVAEHDVLGDREDGDEHEVLVDHADAGGHGIPRPTEMLHDVIEEDLALIGTVQAIQDVHEGRLAGTVLAEQRVDLTRLDDEVDVVVGDEPAEAFGDPAELELHSSQSIEKDGYLTECGAEGARSPGPALEGQITASSRTRP